MVIVGSSFKSSRAQRFLIQPKLSTKTSKNSSNYWSVTWKYVIGEIKIAVIQHWDFKLSTTDEPNTKWDFPVVSKKWVQ